MCPRRTPSQKKMAEGSYDTEIEPLLPHQDDDENDDEQEVDRTHPFQAGFASTPCPGGEEIEMQTGSAGQSKRIHKKEVPQSVLRKITSNRVQ